MVWCLSKLYTHKNICKKQLVETKKKKRNREKKATAQTGTRVFNAGLLARS
jgi:hypothetical protein